MLFAVPMFLKIAVLVGFFTVFIILFIKCKYVLQEIESFVDSVFQLTATSSLLAVFIAGGWIMTHTGAPVCRSCGEGSERFKPVFNDLRKPTPRYPNVILVTFDALTAEDMSLYGYKIDTTPNLCNLANESYVFDRMYSNSNWTRPGTVSMLTGRYPASHRMISSLFSDIRLRNETETLPEILHENGFRTAAIANNINYAHPNSNGTYNSFELCPWKIFDVSSFVAQNKQYPIRFYGSWLSRYGLGVYIWIDTWANKFFSALYIAHDSSAIDVTSYPVGLSMGYAERILSGQDSPVFYRFICFLRMVHIYPLLLIWTLLIKCLLLSVKYPFLPILIDQGTMNILDMRIMVLLILYSI